MNRLRELRIANNISQAELGNKVNASNQAISAYESGFRNPKPETWQALADYFNVSVPYLQGKILFVDLSENEQEIFTDVLDVLVSTPYNKVIHVLEALLNSFKECYFEENTRNFKDIDNPTLEDMEHEYKAEELLPLIEHEIKVRSKDGRDQK